MGEVFVSSKGCRIDPNIGVFGGMVAGTPRLRVIDKENLPEDRKSEDLPILEFEMKTRTGRRKKDGSMAGIEDVLEVVVYGDTAKEAAVTITEGDIVDVEGSVRADEYEMPSYVDADAVMRAVETLQMGDQEAALKLLTNAPAAKIKKTRITARRVILRTDGPTEVINDARPLAASAPSQAQPKQAAPPETTLPENPSQNLMDMLAEGMQIPQTGEEYHG